MKNAVQRMPISTVHFTSMLMSMLMLMRTVSSRLSSLRKLPGQGCLVCLFWVSPPVFANGTGSSDGFTDVRAPQALTRLSDALQWPPTLVLDEGAPSTLRPSLLGLESAIYAGLSESWGVKASEQRIASFHYTAKAAQGGLLPRLDMKLAQGRGTLTSVDPSLGLERIDRTLVLRQAIMDMPTFLEWRRQRKLGEAAALQRQGEMGRVMFDITQSYLRTVQARLQLDAHLQNESALNDLLEHVTRRAEAGGASVSERDRVRGRVSSAGAQTAQAKAALQSALRSLTILTGRPATQLRLPTGDLVKIPATAGTAIDEMDAANPDLSATLKEMEALTEERKAVLARFLPVLSVDVSHIDSRNASGQLSVLTDTRVLFTLNWSLLNGGSDAWQSHASSARRMEREFQREDVRRRLRDELENAYSVLRTIDRRFDALWDERSANSRVREAFRFQMELGNRSLLDVLDAQQRLHQGHLELIALAIQELQLHARIAFITGRFPGVLNGSLP